MEIQQLREQLENQNDQLNLLKRKCKEKLFKAEKNRKLQKDEWNNVLSGCIYIYIYRYIRIY